MKGIHKRVGRGSALFLIIGALLLLLPFLIISIYNHPSADDFSYSDFGNRFNFWAAQIEHYYTWTGRYMATALLTIYPIDYTNLTFYRVLPVLLFISFVFSIYLFLKKLLLNTSKEDISILALLILFLYIYYTPNISEAFYWMPGSVTYQLASILSLLLFSILVDLFRLKNSNKKTFLLILSSILCLVIVGLNETSMLILFVLMFLLFAITFYIQKTPNFIFLTLFLVTAVASALVSLAPGNLVRMAEKPDRFQFLFSVAGSLKTSLIYLAGWIPMLLLIIVLFSPLLNRIAGNLRTRYPLKELSFFQISFLAVAFFGFISLCFFPSYWSQGGKPPSRTVNVIYLLFILGALALSTLFFLFLQNQNRPISKLPAGISVFIILLVLSIIVLKPNNIRGVYKDLFTGTAALYDLEMKQRYKVLEECNTRCVVSPIKNRPSTIFAYDLATKRSEEIYYYNRDLGHYFGLEEVMATK